MVEAMPDESAGTVRRSREVRGVIYEWLLLTPALGLLAALTLFPIVYNIGLSLYQKHAYLPEKQFIGLRNFVDLFHDPEFFTSFRNGAVYAVATIVLQIAVGTAAALLLNKKFMGRDLVRGVLLFPYLVPTIVVVILWKWLLNASYGLVNYFALSLGFVSGPIIWFSQDLILLTLILISTWQFFPFVLVSVLARLQTIPEELYQAARMDNAPAASQFMHITLPALRNVLITVTLLRSIWMFTKFDTVWLLAGREGIGKYIQTLPIYTYRVTFEYLQAGMGAAISVVLLLFLAIGSGTYLFALHRNGGHQ